MPVVDNKFQRVEPDDPRRCQASTKIGQCPYKAAEGAKNCSMHQGTRGIEEKKSQKMYRLAKWGDRMSQFADDPQVKSLREEIGILRIVLEETVNMCQEPAQILLYASKITDTVVKIEKLVASCHRLEASTGMLLDKSAALHLAGVIVEIIGRNVPDEQIVDDISTEIVTAILETQMASKKEKMGG